MQADSLHEMYELMERINLLCTADESEESINSRCSLKSLKNYAKTEKQIHLYDSIRDSEETMKSSMHICNYLFNEYKRLAQDRSHGRDSRMLVLEMQLRETIRKIEALDGQIKLSKLCLKKSDTSVETTYQLDQR